MKKYSASMTKLSFWFLEFRQMVALLDQGRTVDDIAKLSVEENLFSASTDARGKQIFNALSRRISSLDPSIYSVFDRGDVSSQKIIALISIMNIDALFFDFVYEVYREKLLMGECVLSDSDLRRFFAAKQQQNGQVAGWHDYTLTRLGNSYKSMLLEAGVAVRHSNEYRLVPPILSPVLEDWMKSQGMEPFIRALIGGR